ncbi:MAG: HAD-IIIA family hydrolase [Thermoleophilaceae bacterium]|nr:HAD-IIIA family hydrolase [Thermoleophilaceae bacterium]
MSAAALYDVVIPSAGRESLRELLRALARARGPAAGRVIVVDDRPGGPPAPAPTGVEVVRGPGRGPAAARNAGWRAATAEWVAFLDDDVLPEPDWTERLARDLAVAGADVGAVQGRVRVPLPAHRRPRDWERNVAGLERAVWATADMAFRRSALELVGGFDERFRRAYREDSDIGLRLRAAGLRIERGSRRVVHPPGTAPPWASLSKQAGNADDQLMRTLHGRGWRASAQAPPGRLRAHLATTALALLALAAGAARRRRLAAAAGAGWLGGTAELAWRRIAPGPRDAREVALMAATSAALPLWASARCAEGAARWRVLPAARRRRLEPWGARPRAVLLDRDGTLIHDVPWNGDPGRVAALDGVRAALDRLRAAGVPLAVVTNQSGVGRGLLGRAQVEAVNRRVEELLGPFDHWAVCPHAPGEGCGCRKPRPGLVLEAAGRLGVPPRRCVVVGDTGADVEAARAAGARAVLVPNARTRREEVAAAPAVAPDLRAAVELLLRGAR